VHWVACFVLASLCALTLGVLGLSDVEDGFLPVSSVNLALRREKVAQESPFALLLKVGEVEISEGISTVLVEALAGLPEGSTAYLIVQFYESLTTAVDDRLDGMNAVLLEYIPNRAFLVALPSSAVTEISSLSEVRAVVALKPEWKISPRLTEEMQSFPGSSHSVWIESFEPIDEAYSNVDRLEEGLYEGRVTADGIVRLSEDPHVKWIQLRPIEHLSLAESVPLVGADDVWYAYTGLGLGIAVIDTGIDSDHPHFASVTVTSSYDWVDADWNPEDGHGHGTHCSGIVAGGSSPGGNTIAGVASGASLVIERVFDSGGGWHGGTYSQIFDYAVNSGATILSNSWGHDSGGQYDSGARSVDQYAYDNQDILLVFANGNFPDSSYVDSPGMAKNVVAVGATWDGSLDRVTPQTVDYTSAWSADLVSSLNNLIGCEDLRTKPDVVAPGENIVSSIVGAWASWSGTSMATPHVSGLAALFRELYPMRPAPVIKAALLASPIDLDDKSGQSSYAHGWGKVPSARDMLWVNPWESTQSYFSGSVAHGEESTHAFTVPVGTDKVIVTLVWWDPAASALADPAIVNDLDLYVGPTSSPYQAGSWSGVETVERVIIDNPLPTGAWLISVDGWSIPGVGSQQYYGYLKVLDTASPTSARSWGWTKPSGDDTSPSAQIRADEELRDLTMTVEENETFTVTAEWSVSAFYVSGAHVSFEPMIPQIQHVSGATGFVIGELHQGESWSGSGQFRCAQFGTYDNAIKLTFDGTNASSWVTYLDVICSPAPTPAVFRVDEAGNLLADSSFYGLGFYSGSADVAEWVSISELVEPGDVLEFDPDNPGHYRKSRGPYSDLVAGVVSTDPGFVLGSEVQSSAIGVSSVTDDSRLPTPDSALLALIGIVSVKVTNEGGIIQPGDLLVSSTRLGYAMRWDHGDGSSCDLIGKALEPLDSDTGVIQVLLMR
jgi:subtilisin family serine protease